MDQKAEWGALLCVNNSCNPCSTNIISTFEQDYSNLTYQVSLTHTSTDDTALRFHSITAGE